MQFGSKFFTQSEQLFDIPAERVIVFARLVLAAFSLIAFYLDPTQPTGYAPVAYGILIAYLLFAVAYVIRTARRLPKFPEQIAVHFADILSISTLMFLTEGPTSPFFVYFTFILLAGTLRWSSRGAMSTAAALVVVYLFLTLSVLDQLLLNYDGVNRSIIRSGYLIVAGAMLAYFGAFRERSRTRLATLVAWPGPEPTSGTATPIASALAHVAEVMQVPRVLVVWEQYDEPFTFTALWSNGELRQERERNDRFGSLVAPAYTSATFAVRDAAAARDPSSPHKDVAAARIINGELQGAFQIEEVLTAPFEGTFCIGRLFLLDRFQVFDDDLLLTDLIAARIGVELDHHALRTQLNVLGAAEERARLARDLHDGVLQGLAAANIQLKLASAASSDGVRDQIGRTRELLIEEQRRIRAFVEETRSQSGRDGAHVELAPDLEQRATRLSRHWGCEVRYAVTPRDLKADPTIARQLRSMIDEAVSNAVRHGKASLVKISVYRSGDRLCLTITDDGCGFAATAKSYNEVQVTTQNLGPLSLKSRVADLGGMMNVVTSRSGTEILIEVPHEQE